MLRKEIEQYMKEKGIDQIDLIFNKNDKLGIYCRLTNGTLKDYTNHVVDRKTNIWGRLVWENGKSTKQAWNK